MDFKCSCLCCPSGPPSDDETERLVRPPRSPGEPQVLAQSTLTRSASSSLRPPVGGQQSSQSTLTRGGQPSAGASYQPSIKRYVSDSPPSGKPPKGAPSKEPYYSGKISTRKAEDLLKHTQRLDGTFLIRDCEIRAPDGNPDFVLSMMRDGIVYHLDIYRGQDKKYSLGDMPSAKSFGSVAKLVSYYQSKPIDLTGGGSVLLKYYLPAK